MSPRSLRRPTGTHVRELGDVASAPPREHEIRDVLAIAPFRRLWISLSLSSLGDWLGFLATTSLAQQLVGTYSAKLYAIGGVLFVRLLPAVVIGPFAGAWADRFNRRTTMVVTDGIRFGLFVSIPLVRTLPWLLIASFLIECASLFWIPAKEASIPNLVPRAKLEAANQLNLVTTYGFGAIAAAVFSALSFVNRVLAHEVTFFRTNPVDLALYLDALTFLVSGLTIINLRQISSARPSDSQSTAPVEQVGLLRSIAEGVRFLAHEPWLKGLVIGISGATGAGAAVIGLSRVFANDLNGGNAAYGVLFGTVFVGLASGMFLGPKAVGGLSRRRVVGLAIIGSGVTLAIDAVVPNLALAVVLTGMLGFFAGVVWVVALTLVGSEVADEIRGRTFAFIYNLMRIVLLVMVAAAPFIAGVIGQHTLSVQRAHVRLDGVTLTLFGAGVIAVIVGVVCLRMMDDRRDVTLRADLVAALRRRAPEQGRGQGGLFIAFEGGEGAGKSTQAARLVSALRSRGYDVVATFEPGATAVGRQIRTVLLDRSNTDMSARTEAMLYAADRAQHVNEVIRPALERGAIVVTDRYVDSSLAYQGAGRALDPHEVRRLSRWASDGLSPDLTVLLDVAPGVGLARVTGPGDRLEAEAVAFHERVRESFLDLARRGRDHYLVIDVTEAGADDVHERILDRVTTRLLDLPVHHTTLTMPLARMDAQ
ncbi:MAG TPA: dTMP kinase [Mycobacteriales bacterium]|nr:dTMP kinase [Mycobacteriales bacterium]